MRLVRLLLVPVLMLIGMAEVAQAHAVVTGSEPEDGAVLAGPPSEVLIRFSEPVSLGRAQVLGPTGEDILAPDAAQGGDEGLRLTLPSSIAEGTYTVSYHIVSLDGHPVSGSLVFSIGRVSGTTPAQGAEEDAAWRWSFVAVHAVLYLGMFGAAGGVIFTRLARPSERSGETTRGIVAGSAILGIGAAIAVLGLQGALLLGGPPSILLDPETWLAGIASTFGRTALCALLGLGLIRLGSQARPMIAASRPLRLIGAILVLGSFALSGHVITAGPRELTAPPLLLHVAVAALWMGSLLPLYRALETPVAEAGPLLRSFSRLAVGAVPVLILAGLVMAWLQIRHPEALIGTEYGRLFLVKLALVTGLLGLAALNRLRLTPALARGDKGAARRLGGSILAEIGLVVAILAVTATLGTTPPPRALLTGSAKEVAELRARHEHGPMHGGRRLELTGPGFEALVELEPGQVGANTATITLRSPEGQPLDVPEVTLRLSNPDRGIAPLVRPAEREAIGRWRAPDVVLGATGTWEVELDVLVSDFERQTAETRLDLE